MGDPAGVGPELIAKLHQSRPEEALLVYGDENVLARSAKVRRIKKPGDVSSGLNVIHSPCAQPPVAGKGDLANAPAVIDWIKAAVLAVKNGEARALVTAPINKANLVEGAAFSYPGHTEFLAALDGDATPVMMLSAASILRVVPATIHMPLRAVASELTATKLRAVIEVTNRELTRFLGQPPRIAVAGLNPHAGENGMLGHEELEWINPLIASLQNEGMSIFGTLSADTMFHARARKNYDVAICMYHDQALIPIKTLAFDQGVNVTLGLSFLRTSPDHGTAYDIAGQGLANPSSFLAAYEQADLWSKNG